MSSPWDLDIFGLGNGVFVTGTLSPTNLKCDKALKKIVSMILIACGVDVSISVFFCYGSEWSNRHALFPVKVWYGIK